MQSYPIIIPIYSGGPMTADGVKVMITMYIVAFIIWIITSIISTVQFYRNGYRNFFEYYFTDGYIFCSVWNAFMSGITVALVFMVFCIWLSHQIF